MTGPAITLNGEQTPAPAKARSTGRIWLVIIVSLLLMNATIVAITVYYATSDKSVVTEPDYYAKAVDFESVIKQRETSALLGWSAAPSLRAAIDGRTMELVITLADREGQPLSGASVSAVAFANTRAGQRQPLTLTSVDQASNKYASPIMIDRSGVWNIRITATRDGKNFTRDAELLVPKLSR